MTSWSPKRMEGELNLSGDTLLAAEDDVFDLLDRHYVAERLGDVKVNILFSCVNADNWREDSWVEDDGTPSFIIKLPYEQIKTMDPEAVRELMLQKALERLLGTT